MSCSRSEQPARLIGRVANDKRAVRLFMSLSAVVVQRRSRFHAVFRRSFGRKQVLEDSCFSIPSPLPSDFASETHPRKCGESDWTDFIDSSLQAPIVIVDGLFPEYDAGFDIELGISTTVTLSALNESSIRTMLRTSCCMS